MCIDKDTIFKILELLISASVPVVIFIFGIIVTRKIEDAKNESAKKYYWQTKWKESFFEKHKGYINTVAALLANYELLSSFVQKGTQNGPEGMAFQNEIKSLIIKVFKESKELRILAVSLFGEADEITKTIEKVFSMFANLVNNKAGNLGEIYNELNNLNTITQKFFDKPKTN